MQNESTTILIVDDKPQNLQLLKSYLNDAGWKVIIATDGITALQRARKKQPQMALLDIYMPEMDGFELCKRFKLDPNLAEIPLLFVTAATDAESVTKGFEAGAVDYILKPIRKEELLARIKNHLQLSSLQKDLKKEVSKKSRDLMISEERLKIAIEGTQDGLWDWDLQNNTAFFSDRFETMLGYKPGTLPRTGEAWSSLLHPDDKDKAFQQLQDYLKGKTSTYNSQFRMKNQKGDYNWIEGRGKALFSHEGKPLRIIGFNQDITLQKEAELALKESEQKYRKLFERSSNAIFIIDCNTEKYLDANKAAEDLTGRSIEELKKMRADDFSTGCCKNRSGERIFRQPDGSEKVALVDIVPIDGTQVFEIAQDITLLKQSLKETEESRARFQSIIENTKDTIWAVNQKMELIYGNQVFMEGFKNFFNPELRIGDNLLDYLSGEMKTQWKKRLTSVLQGEFLNMEESLTLPDGTCYQIHFRLHPIEREGHIYGASVFSTDITEKHKNEEILQRMEKLESIGTLAGGIAHDFNNLLTALFGNVSLAKLSIDESDEAYHYLDDAENSLDRATSLTRQLLTFAKGGQPQKEKLHLEQILKDLLTLDLSGSNVKAELTVDKELWPIFGDKGQLQQVFSNLIINAVQAMPEGGILQISLCNKAEENSVEIKVKDQGIGISSKALGKIFDPYFTTKSNGTGLGLATSYSIIHKHNGEISVNSQEGSGTEFTIRLPALTEKGKKIKAQEPLSPVSETSGASNKNLLLMEDEAMVAETAEKILNALGFSVTVTHNGEETLEEYASSLKRKDPYSLVILDLTIRGGMGGIKTIEGILKMDPQASCIVSSGYFSDPVLANYSEYGFKGKILKPYTFQTMKEGLMNYL